MKKQTKSNIKAHLLRSASYVLLLGVCIIPFALAQTPISSSWKGGGNYPVVIQSPAVASDGTYAYAGTGFWGYASNSFYQYDPAAGWTALPNAPLAVSQARAVYAANTHSIYIFGGRDDS